MGEPLVFEGVSPRSLGDLLKGYGLIAALGQACPETRFWWNDGFHLVADVPVSGDQSKAVREACKKLPPWAENVAHSFKRQRQKSCNRPLPCLDHPDAKKKGKKTTCPVVVVPSTESPLKSRAGHDKFETAMAEIARAVAVPAGALARNAEPHPWFPGYGQEASGNYFEKLAEAATSANKSPGDLDWSIFGLKPKPIKEIIDKAYLFFPEPTKRYATGVSRWEQEKAPVTAWCFLLALRGALLLRGTSRRPRWRHSGYPAFPFVFDSGGVSEVHLPTWSRDRPRTLGELLIQVRQFHVPLAQSSFAATASEFRAAVQRRGPAVGFDVFHRFVLEARRPGQQQRMPQAIPRGVTRVRPASATIDLRSMIAPLGVSGWIDGFQLSPRRRDDSGRDYSLQKVRVLDEAIHRAIDEPGPLSYLGILEAVASLNRELLAPGKLRRAFEEHGRTPRPAPPLPVASWEKALQAGLDSRAEWRLARALGSIVGAKGDGQAVGPILEQILPLRYDWNRKTWRPPELSKRESAFCAWNGRMPMQDFCALMWRRWLASESLPQLPFSGRRAAPLNDVLRLLRGELDVLTIHRLTPLFAQLDWQRVGRAGEPRVGTDAPVSPAYAALRLWLELGIEPAPESRPPRDGEIPRLLSLGGARQVEAATTRALARLRVQGLPWHTHPAPMGKAVARFRPRLTEPEAKHMALAVLIPISHDDLWALSRRLLVAVNDKEMSA